MGCLVSVVAWLNFIFSLTKLPYIGLTIMMTRSVLAKFISVMLPVLLFILPFAIGFYMSLGGMVSQSPISLTICISIILFEQDNISAVSYFQSCTNLTISSTSVWYVQVLPLLLLESDGHADW